MQEIVSGIALVLGAVGSLIGAVSLFKGQKGQQESSKLEVAWAIQSKHLDTISSENIDLRNRQTQQQGVINDLQSQLKECRDGRRQLETQVEILKLKLR